MHFGQQLITLILLVISYVSFSQEAPGLVFGGADNDAGYSISTTFKDGYILAGATRNGTIGSWDAWAISLTEMGKTNWSRTYGWEHHDYFSDVLALEDGFLFVGHIWGQGHGRLDIYLLKTDLLGSKVFDKVYGTNRQDLGFRVYPSAMGGYLILGYSRGYENHGDILIIKIDNDGNETWRSSFGTIYDDYAYSLSEAQNGAITLFGSAGSYHHDVHYNYKSPSADWLMIGIDENGMETDRDTIKWEGHDFARTIKPDGYGGFYLFGSSQSFGAGSFDMILTHIDDDRNITWQKTFGGADYEYGMSMEINKEGDLYLFGTTRSLGDENSPDYFLVKTDNEGNQIWSLTLGGVHPDYGHDVVSTPDNGCALIGNTKSFGEGGFDMLMVKVDKYGVVEFLLESLDNSVSQNLLVYPNPVRATGAILPEQQNATYQLDIVSLSGQTVRSYLLESPNYQFNAETLPSGMYVYRITRPGQPDFYLSGKLMKN
jgi:hypothetical protein